MRGKEVEDNVIQMPDGVAIGDLGGEAQITEI